MESYDQRWRSFHFWNRVGLIAVFALVPVVAFGVFATLGSSDFPAFPFLLVLMWLVALLGALYRIRTFRCPRCGKSFSVQAWGWIPSARGRRCVHCALELDPG